MSTNVLPSMPLLMYPWKRSTQSQSNRQENISGKEVRLTYWSSPRYIWELSYSALRQGLFQNPSAWYEFSTMMGFFEARGGQFDSFLYADPDDNTVSSQIIAVATAGQSQYQLCRTFGGSTVPIYAPNLAAPVTVRVNGVVQTNNWSITDWSGSPPGVLSFGTPQAGGDVISADFSYYFPCTFNQDILSFDKFMSNLYDLKKMSFRSIK